MRSCRLYRQVTGAINDPDSPDLRYWSQKEQRFTSGTDTAKTNNPVLDTLCSLWDELLNNSAVTSPGEFVEALKRGVVPSDMPTLGDYLRSLIDKMKNGMDNKRPSCNY